MNSHGVLSSIFWKDYRELRAFWLVTALFGIGLQAAVAFVATRMNIAEFFRVPILAWAVLVPALYTLGCAAVMFAGEHESGTASLLHALPVEPRRLLLGHALFALLSTLVMLAATCSAFLVLRRVMPIEMGSLALTAGQLGILPAELFVWGLLFSLLLRRAIFVAILGGLFGALVPIVCAIQADLQHDTGIQVMWWTQVLPIRAAVVLLVAAVDVWLVGRWFHDAGVLGRQKTARRESRSALQGLSRLDHRSGSATTSEYTVGEFSWQHRTHGESAGSNCHPIPLTTSTFEFGRLVWQQWRQSRWLLIGFMAFMVPFLTLAFNSALLSNDSDAYMGFLAFTLIMIPLAGSCVFREDWQENRFRFLADHGARPGRVWLSRQLVWFAPALACVLIFLVGIFVLLLREPSGEMMDKTLALILFSGTAFACGQFCSLYLRSSIVAGFCSLILFLVLYTWAEFLLALKVSLLWAFVPIPIMLLVATRLRIADWMLQRTDWRARARAVLVPLAPVLVIWAVLPFYRVYSVPGGGPGFSVEESNRPPTAEAAATSRMYLDARESLEWPKAEPNRVIQHVRDLTEDFEPPTMEGLFPLVPLSPLETAWVEMNPEAIRKAIEASRRTAMAFESPSFRSGKLATGYDVGTLAELLVRSARKHAFEGDLDGALEHYLAALRMTSHIEKLSSWPWSGHVPEQIRDGLLSWAAHPDQTADRVKRALDEVKRIPADYSGYERYVKWCWQSDLSDLGQRSLSNENWDEGVQLLALQWFPWEKTRARRVLDYLARDALGRLRQVKTRLKENAQVGPAPMSLEAARFCDGTSLWHLAVNTGRCLTEEHIDAEMHRRAFILQLALAAWRREHGSLPKTLDELVGTYLDAVPVDPHTGMPFEYYPEGERDAGLGMPMGMTVHDLGPGMAMPEAGWEGPMGHFDASYFAREKAQWGAPYFRGAKNVFYIP